MLVVVVLLVVTPAIVSDVCSTDGLALCSSRKLGLDEGIDEPSNPVRSRSVPDGFDGLVLIPTTMFGVSEGTDDVSNSATSTSVGATVEVALVWAIVTCEGNCGPTA